MAQDSDDTEGGIIGTGIVGTITKLGSIYVNGQHIHLDKELPLAGAVPAKSAADLRPGHTVAVTVQAQGSDWRALDIRQVLPLVGPVEIDAAGQLAIMGSRISPTASLQDGPPDIASGDWLAVSGLWQGDRVLASHIERLAPSEGQARVTGTYLGTDISGQTLVGGTVLTGAQPRHLQPGDVLRITGQPSETGIAAQQIETGWFTTQTGLIQVEGYYSPPQPDGLYTILGSGLVAYTSNPGMIATQNRILQCGTQGRLRDATTFAPSEREQAQHLGCTLP
jgi:hypothetical protein